MYIANDLMQTIVKQLKGIQLTLANLEAEMERWRRRSVLPTEKCHLEVESDDEPPTEKQIQYLKGLGVEEIPTSKLEARQLLTEIIEKREIGEYSIPPTTKQLQYLRNLKYEGPTPATKDEAWRLIQDLQKIE